MLHQPETSSGQDGKKSFLTARKFQRYAIPDSIICNENGTERNGTERNGTERNFLRGVHTAMDRFAVLISSSLGIKIFYARY